MSHDRKTLKAAAEVCSNERDPEHNEECACEACYALRCAAEAIRALPVTEPLQHSKTCTLQLGDPEMCDCDATLPPVESNAGETPEVFPTRTECPREYAHIPQWKYPDLFDYHIAMDGKTGSLGFDWSDKPHRLVYNLTRMVMELRDQINSANLERQRNAAMEKGST